MGFRWAVRSGDCGGVLKLLFSSDSPVSNNSSKAVWSICVCVNEDWLASGAGVGFFTSNIVSVRWTFLADLFTEVLEHEDELGLDVDAVDLGSFLPVLFNDECLVNGPFNRSLFWLIMVLKNEGLKLLLVMHPSVCLYRLCGNVTPAILKSLP